MLLSLVYFVVRSLLGALAPLRRSDLEREAELLVLRHQVKVLSRRARRPLFRRGDRILFAAASRVLPRSRWKAFVVSARTLLRWHRELVRRKRTYRRRGVNLDLDDAKHVRSRGRSKGLRDLLLTVAEMSDGSIPSPAGTTYRAPEW